MNDARAAMGQFGFFDVDKRLAALQVATAA
jgi:hypothetical protein